MEKNREEQCVWFWRPVWAHWPAVPYLAVQAVLHLRPALRPGFGWSKRRVQWLHCNKYKIADALSHTSILPLLSNLLPLDTGWAQVSLLSYTSVKNDICARCKISMPPAPLAQRLCAECKIEPLGPYLTAFRVWEEVGDLARCQDMHLQAWGS